MIGLPSIRTKIKKASTSITYQEQDGTFDVLFLGVGENDGGSTYTLSVNDIEIGKFKNPLSTSSFEEGVKYMHLIGNVEINRGDKITVVSEVGSKDGQGWSRGRWSGIAPVPQGKGRRHSLLWQAWVPPGMSEVQLQQLFLLYILYPRLQVN
jgi:hypothetical protein